MWNAHLRLNIPMKIRAIPTVTVDHKIFNVIIVIIQHKRYRIGGRRGIDIYDVMPGKYSHTYHFILHVEVEIEKVIAPCLSHNIRVVRINQFPEVLVLDNS